MSSLDKIDKRMPLAFYARVYSQITDAKMVALAKILKQPRLLNCSVPLAGATELVISDPAAVTLILNWLKTNQQWRAKIEETLLVLAEDKDGRPLLTAFMPVADLEMFGADLLLDKVPGIRNVASQLLNEIRQWQAMGAEEGTFEGYELTNISHQE